MFNIGDEVEVSVDKPSRYAVTRGGSRGIVVQATQYIVYVKFDHITSAFQEYVGTTFAIDVEHLQLAANDGKSTLDRKIAAIYARQHRKTGYAFFQ